MGLVTAQTVAFGAMFGLWLIVAAGAVHGLRGLTLVRLMAAQTIDGCVGRELGAGVGWVLMAAQAIVGAVRLGAKRVAR